ncbi:hypothetical protein P40081_28430 [Paenibacillus sp. FSL P4-0081]|uniref:hypothetical protein n=1 Tax=Paenibacillus sp. FSL P4-0081 TaxID=1536769 RepID=UPI0004F774CB|nr:hypothetical protein [Paenibacillus sp. FSL P4-0081]AIQ31627.1 hypothetical protein P40081_28430 [Paenibacillus sp. FSL P4-0081]
MQIGRKIYYEKSTGNILVDTGERSGDVVETTQEQDFTSYVAISERIPETVGMIKLEYGQYNQDFAECSGYRVNPGNGKLEFSYPDPNEVPGEPSNPVYQQPLTEQIATLEQRTEANEAAILALLDFGL